MPVNAAKSQTKSLLRRFAMEPIAERRNPSLTMEERFCTMLLRAAMVPDASIVLDRPFNILATPRNALFLKDALRKVDDLIAEINIFDYSWEKDRYGVLDGAEA